MASNNDEKRRVIIEQALADVKLAKKQARGEVK